MDVSTSINICDCCLCSSLLSWLHPCEGVLRDVYVVVLLEKQPGLPHGEDTVDHTEGNAITASQQIPNH